MKSTKTQMKMTLLGTFVAWTQLKKESLRWTIYQQNPQKLKKEGNKRLKKWKKYSRVADIELYM